MELFYLFHDHVQQSVMRLCCLVCNAHQTQDSSLYHHDVYLFMRMGTGSLMGEEGEGQFVAIIFVIFSFRKKTVFVDHSTALIKDECIHHFDYD